TEAGSHGEVARALVEPELHGVAGSRLAEFARGRGLEAIAYRGDMASLRDYLGKGRPLVVAWAAGRGRYHDVVVVGFDDERGAVLVHDPAVGASRPVHAGAFEKRGARAGYWTLLVTRQKEMPPPSRYDQLVSLGMAAGRDGRYAEAAEDLQQAIALAPSRSEARVELAGL